MSETKNSSAVCIDANIIVNTLIPGPFTATALSFVERCTHENVDIVAPALLAFEVTSTLRRSVYLDQVTINQGRTAFEKFLELDIQLSTRRDILPLAWKFANQFNRPRAYDAAYLALARLRNCEFWTADQRLFNAVHGELEWVKWIGDVE